MRKLRFAGLLTGCGASLLATAPAHAASGQATYTMPVTTTVINGCTISATPLSWVLLVPPNGNVDTTATITLQCTPNLNYTIDIDDGLYPQGNSNRRVFNASANAYIRYDVYKDPPRSKIWGKGAANNYPGNSGPTGLTVLTVYGRLTSARTLVAGGYRDTLTITVNY